MYVHVHTYCTIYVYVHGSASVILPKREYHGYNTRTNYSKTVADEPTICGSTESIGSTDKIIPIVLTPCSVDTEHTVADNPDSNLILKKKIVQVARKWKLKAANRLKVRQLTFYDV